MALKIEMNLNKFLDRPTLGDYVLSKETFILYRIITSDEGILLVNVESAVAVKKYKDMAELLESIEIQEMQLIKEENFKLMYMEPGC